MADEFEQILIRVGDYGKYQKLIIGFVMIPTSLFIALAVNSVIFQTVIPEDYWCEVPGRETTTFTEEEWWNLTIPRSESGQFEKCLQFHVKFVNNKYVYTDRNQTEKCSTQWTHDRSMFTETMATSMGWLCDKEIYSTHILSANLAGNAIGTFVLPLLADKHTGRRLMFYIAIGNHLFFNILALVIPYYSVLLAVRFVAGMSFQTNYQMPYIIGLELMSPDRRAEASFYSFVAWTTGMCFTALITWIFPHWRYMIIISIIPSALFFGYWRYLPSSPRWLLSKRKYKECTDVLLQIAKMNKKKVDRISLENQLRNLIKTDDKTEENLQSIFHYKHLILNGTLLTFVSFFVFMCYGCTLVNVKILPNNYFLSYFVLSVSELPSNVLSYSSVHYLGRRFTAIITSLFSIIFCFLATFFLDEPVYLLIAVAMIKIFVTQGIYVVYVVACEIFPTPIRSLGMGIVIVAGMIGIFFSPYIVTFSDSGALQYWIMIGLSVSSLLLSLPLPETIGLPLPQTFAEAENIGKGRPFFRWIHHWNNTKYKYKVVPCEDKNNVKI